MKKVETKKDDVQKKKQELDIKIDNETKRVALLEELENEFEEISKRISRCIDLVSTSVQGKDANALYDDLQNDNRVGTRDFLETIEKDLYTVRKSINDYNDQKRELENATKSIENVSKYLQDSVKNKREIIDNEFTTIISNLEYLKNVELVEQINSNQEQGTKIISVDMMQSQDFIQEKQEEINQLFNSCFEIIDGLVPEEESQDFIILKEEIAKIYNFLKDSDLYEVNTTLQNILTKAKFKTIVIPE